MKISVAVICLGAVCAMPAFGQGRGQAPAPPATDTVAPDIPGVVKAGTKVIVIKDDFQGTEGPIALPDGTVAFTEGGANRITRIDKDGKVSVYLDNTNGSNALAFDSKGRLISVQRGPAHVQIGVIAPKGSEATLADNFEGNPNDLVVTKNDGVVLHSAGTACSGAGKRPAVDAVRAGGVLHRSEQRQVREGGRRHHESQWHSVESRREDDLRQRHARRVSDCDGCPARRHAWAQAQLRQVRGRAEDGRGYGERRRRSCGRQRRPRVRGDRHRRAGVQPEGPAPGHDSAVTRRRRTSPSRVQTRRRSTSSAATPRGRFRCCRQDTRAARSKRLASYATWIESP